MEQWKNRPYSCASLFGNIRKINILIDAIVSSSIYYEFLCVYIYIPEKKNISKYIRRFHVGGIFYHKIHSSIMTLFFSELNMDIVSHKETPLVMKLVFTVE